MVCENQDIDDTKLPAEMDVISRAADAKDIKHYQDNKAFAKDSFEAVNHLVALNQLQMKVIDIVFPLERDYVLITFRRKNGLIFENCCVIWLVISRQGLN